MGALLALIPSKDKLYAGLLAVLVVGGLWYHHKLLAEGIAEQKAADAKAAAVLAKQTAAATAELQARANMAEQAYEKEVNALNELPVPSVRVCVYPHTSGVGLPQGSIPVAGDASPSAAPGNVQSVSAGDSGAGPVAGPDIGGLLSLLAIRADQTSATLREYQNRVAATH